MSMNYDENMVLKIIGEDIINTMYNIGVGHKPHDEANYIKTTKIPDLDVYGVEPNTKIFKDRKKDYVGKLMNVCIWSSNCKKEFNVRKGKEKKTC